MKVLFLLSLWLNSDETRVDREIWVGKCNRIKDSWAIKFGYLMVPRGPSPMPDLGILLYEVPIKFGCFGGSTFVMGWASWNSGKRNDSTKHGGHEWEARGHKCSLDLELLISLSWIPHSSFKLKRLITVVGHELWAETSCQKRPQVGGT